MNTKYIFITGGVVSGLGKGITAASLGRLLKARGLKVTAQKLDPYLNVDPGTMNPVQHGEVFVTDDGAETDLDLGHYERFIDESLSQNSNLTSGRVFWKVISDERKGVYGGQTIQIIPHVRMKSSVIFLKMQKMVRMSVLLKSAEQSVILSHSLLLSLFVSLLWMSAERIVCLSTLRLCRILPHLMSLNQSLPSIL